MLFELQAVRDREPGRLRADEDGMRRNRWSVDERCHGDMDKSAVADQRIEKGATLRCASCALPSPNRKMSSAPPVTASFTRSMPATA